MSVAPLGRLADGTPVEQVSLSGGGLGVQVLSLGARIQDLRFDVGSGARRCVLGFARLEDYVVHAPYFGCVAGRYANRIADGRCVVDGKVHQLSRNEAGRTHLHGGEVGFGRRVWQIRDHGPGHVLMELVSPDGEEGYPGTLTASCCYQITGDGELTIKLGASADRATIVNLATHSYFNLDDGGDILDHVLEIPAAHYLPVDARLIPSGEIAAVAGTPFDFRRARPLRAPAGDAATAYDHNFVLRRKRSTETRLAARLTGPRSRTQLEIHSTEPGLQLYDGAALALPVPGHDGRRYGAHAGLCLEPQNFPDAPNHADFPDAVLRPGETYRQVTIYRFSAA